MIDINMPSAFVNSSKKISSHLVINDKQKKQRRFFLLS